MRLARWCSLLLMAIFIAGCTHCKPKIVTNFKSELGSKGEMHKTIDRLAIGISCAW